MATVPWAVRARIGRYSRSAGRAVAVSLRRELSAGPAQNRTTSGVVSCRLLAAASGAPVMRISAMTRSAVSRLRCASGGSADHAVRPVSRATALPPAARSCR